MQENIFLRYRKSCYGKSRYLRDYCIVYMHFMNLNMTFKEEVLDWIMPINTKKMCVIDSHAMLILSDNVEAF